MPTAHINAKQGDFAKVVLMPGDPLRAKWIAENYLHDYKEVTNVRGILGFTGLTKSGKRISVMASGMGLPSIGIYSHELFAEYGVETIIRVGTCGAYQPEINLFDVLVCTTASTDSNWAHQFDVPMFSAGSDFELTLSAYNAIKKAGMPMHCGAILSADVFYDEDQNSWKKWAKLNIMGVEMESYALYTTAQRLKKRALCILTVSDHFIKEGKATSEQRQKGLGKMIEIAIATAEPFCE